MKIEITRLRYTQFFLLLLLITSLFVTSLSLPNGMLEFEQNFWGRKKLISSFAELKLILKDRVFSQVLVNDQGWMEFTGDQNLDDYQNAIPFSPKMQKKLQTKILELYNELHKRNITLLIVIPPNKASIYADKLPPEIQKLNKKSNLDLLKEYLTEQGPPVLLDIRPALANGRKERDIYYKTDTHWNAYGAFIAYTVIMQELSKTYPQLTPKTIENFEFLTDDPSVRDLSQIIGATNIREDIIGFKHIQSNTNWVTINNNDRIPMSISTLPDKNLPKLMMYIDSFGNSTKSIIATHFQEATFIQNDTRDPRLTSLAKIDEIKPNVVIIEMVERSLSNNRLNDLLKRLISENTSPENQNTAP